MKLKPEILTHPNIPKPLHGLNPRSILGKEWWDNVRFSAQKKSDYKCVVCGIRKKDATPAWLEGHEHYEFNYDTGIIEVVEIVSLCHKCHNFIHSGRLYKEIGGKKTKQEVKDILKHGFNILKNNGLKCFGNTLEIAKIINVDTMWLDETHLRFNNNLKWGDFKLLLNNTLYDSKFGSYKEWKKYYNNV